MIFDNTIDELLAEAEIYKQKHGIKPNFISDWNPASENIIDIQFSRDIDKEGVNKYNYLYSIDDISYKDQFKSYCSKKHYPSEAFDFSLFSNSTIALYLIFKSLKMRTSKNILVFTPCYFTSESALISLGFNIFFVPALNNNLDKTAILTSIQENKIDTILITDPLYGLGISVDNQVYSSLIDIAKKINLTLIIDYSYGNMVWNNSDHILNNSLISTLSSSGINYYLVDSLPKKLFLNGVKFSLLFSNRENIAYIEYLSLFIEGSITAEQFKIYYQCYNEKNSELINRTINNYIRKSQDAYHLVKTLLLDNENMKIADTDSSIFTLVGMRRKHSIKKDMSFAKSLIKKCGVFLTPHSRYKIYDPDWFYFRINLLLDKNKLIESLIKLTGL